MDLKKYAFLPDIHCGYEFDDENYTFTESHDATLLRKVVACMVRFKPDYIVFGGDQINLSCISRWTTGKPRMIEGRRIEEDYEFFLNLVWKPLLQKINHNWHAIWLEGNHEERLRELAHRNPQLAGLLTHEKLLATVGISQTAMQYVHTGKLWRPPNAKVWFTHGHIYASGTNPAKNIVEAYGRSVRAGHFHRHITWTRNVAADREDFHTGIISAPLCRPNLPYAKNKPSSNQKGFMTGYYDPESGFFWDTHTSVIDGHFIHEGKLY